MNFITRLVTTAFILPLTVAPVEARQMAHIEAPQTMVAPFNSTGKDYNNMGAPCVVSKGETVSVHVYNQNGSSWINGSGCSVKF